MGVMGERFVKMAQQPGVKVHIEELVLEGFPPGDRYRISSAMEQELAWLMGEERASGWQQRPLALERMMGGTFHLKAGAKPQAAGIEIARAVFRSLRQHAKASASAPRTRPGTGGRHP